MGKHGTDHSMASAVVVITAIALVIIGVIVLVIVNPQWAPAG